MMTLLGRPLLSLLTVMLAAIGVPQAAAGQPRAGEATVAWHVTLAPSWFDPSTAPPQITAFGMLYAIHDALLRPLPGQKIGSSLAETWTESHDGRVYEFKLRRGLKFHNGEPVTADDVKFSFDRYNGVGARAFRERVQHVEVVDPLTVRFQLTEPWPDFLMFYGTSATAAGIVVPKKYLSQVGEDGFKKHPIGAGPYRFVSHTPGVEVVLQAYPDYWRLAPHIKRITMKSVTEGTTRVAMVKNGEADLAVALEGEDAESARRDPRLRLVATRHASLAWIEFADQWDSRSPWHDRRLRLAVNHALDRKALNESACLGHCPPTGVIVPRVMDFALRVEAPGYNPHRAKQLLAEAGYPQGLGGWREFAERRRHPDPAAADRAGRLQRRVAREEAARSVHGRRRQLRERCEQGRRVHLLEGQLRLWRLSGHRRVVPPAGSGARPPQARGLAPSHPAAHRRSGDVRAHHGHASAHGRRTTRGRRRDRPGTDGLLPVLGGHAPQGLTQ
jgi:peptide/nickel transport system substrate-binding protein